MDAFGKRGLEDRFGVANEPKRFKKDEIGVTTIGFGANAIPVPSGSSKLTPLNLTGSKSGKKMVSFSTTSINTSNSDNSHNEDDDDDDENDETQEDATGGVEKLFMSEQERKEYLEKEFQQALIDYNKILKRLENANIVF